MSNPPSPFLSTLAYKLPEARADTTVWITAAPPVNARSLPLLFCSRGALGLLPTHIQNHPFCAGSHIQKNKNNNKNNNLRVVGKAPCTLLTWLKIHKATGKNNVNPWAGRCRSIFTAGVDAAAERERRYSGKKKQRGGGDAGRSVSLASQFRTDEEEPGC